MSQYRNVAPDRRDEVAPQRARHDMRRFGLKVADTLRTPMGSMVVMLVLAVMSFAVPALSDVLLIIGLGLALFIKNAQNQYTLPAKIPRHSGLLDPMETNPGSSKPTPARGTFYLGNDRVTGEEVWLTNRDAGVHMLVLGTTGSGKAQPLDAKIHTPEGWKRMGEIKVGDFVSSPDGSSSKVTGVFPQGELEIFRVTFADGRTTEACANHLWEVHHKHWNGKYKPGISRAHGAAPRVLKTHEVASLLNRNKGVFSVRLPNPVQKPEAALPLHPYLLGLLLGDGNFTGNRLRFSAADQDLVEAMSEVLPREIELTQYQSDSSCDYELRFKPEHRSAGGRNEDGSYVQNPVRIGLRALGLDGAGSFDKFIPSVYLESSVEQRISLLRGLLDSDGHACGKSTNVSFCSSSFQLSSDVQEIVRSLGGIASISEKNPTYTYLGVKKNGAVSYIVNIRHPRPDWLFSLDRKRDRCKSYQYAESLKLGIVGIESVGVKPAQCIMVDHVDHLYITDNYVVTHNTEMLLGICQNSLNQGSGFMFVDGKAQDKIAFKIQDLCRARGRDDDVLILNFMTGARDIIGAQANKITNTMNPFSYGSSGMISQIVVGLMAGGSGGDDMWKDRAISFVESLSPPLTYLRDNYGLMLDVNEYRKFFEMDRLEELCWKGAEKYPGLEQVLDPMRNYLNNLPGYDKGKYGKRGGQGDDTKLQHGYITMQLVRAFTSLADTYGHIVRVPLGEVFFPDLVKQRRILIAMLPSLEKTPSETANIGKIIVTALRNIMAEGLGSVLEGSRNDLDNDDGRALLPPYVVILDEYGYYAVKGFAVAFAQARSLGFVCVVGGQDLASFQRESKEEAVSICGNTRIKAFGSIEDPDQTMDFALKTAGKAQVAETGGYDGEAGTLSVGYSDTMNVHLKSQDRIDPSDVKEQIEGQFHFVWRSRVIRAQTYYVNPKKVKRVQLNHFLQVQPPDQLQLDEIEMSTSGLAAKLATIDLTILEAGTSREIESAASILAVPMNLGVVEHSIAAIIGVGRDRQQYIQKYRESVRTGGSESGRRVLSDEEGGSVDDEMEFGEFAADELGEFDANSFFNEEASGGQTGQERDSPSARELEQEDRAASYSRSAVDSMLDAPPGPELNAVTPLAQMHVFAPIKQTGFGADVFASDSAIARSVQEALISPDDAAPLLNFNATLRGVESIERRLGATPEAASATARGVVKEIEDASRYPQVMPAEKSAEQVGDLIQQLLSELGE